MPRCGSNPAASGSHPRASGTEGNHSPAALVGKEGEISTDASRLRVMVIPTNEELLIARDTFRAVRGLPNPH